MTTARLFAVMARTARSSLAKWEYTSQRIWALDAESAEKFYLERLRAKGYGRVEICGKSEDVTPQKLPTVAGAATTTEAPTASEPRVMHRYGDTRCKTCGRRSIAYLCASCQAENQAASSCASCGGRAFHESWCPTLGDAA